MRTGTKAAIALAARTNLCRVLLAGLAVIALTSCGGGGGGGDGATCTPAPQISSDPPTVATVGQQYRYDYDAAYFCLIFVLPATCNGVEGVQLPSGAGIDEIRDAVYWTPAANQANTNVQFQIATQPDICGNRATQSWAVHVSAAPPPQVPQVTSTSPPADATNVSILVNIAVAFNQSIDPQSVDASSFHVAGPAGAVPGNLAVNGATVTFTPDARLSYASTYTVTATTEVRTVRGAPLPSNHISSFVTGQPVVEFVTNEATNVTTTSATLNGRVVAPFDVTTFVWFEYGTTTAYGSTTDRRSLTIAGDTQVPADIAGLQEGTSIHFRLVAENSGDRFFGADRTFTTYATPRVLIEGLDAPTGLTSDGTYLYWSEIYASRLMRMNASSGLSDTLAVAPMQGNQGALTMDGADVYWSDIDNIRRTRLDGGGTTNFAVRTNVTLLKVHASGLYVRHADFISRLSLDGSTGTVLYTRTPQASGGFGGDLAVDTANIYWTDYFAGTLNKMPLGGGEATTLATGLRRPNSIVLDGASLYFAEATGIKRTSIHGGAVANIAPITGRMVLAGATIYVGTDSTIARVDVNTGAVETLVANQTSFSLPGGCVNELALDAGNIYWICWGARFFPPMGSVRSIPK